MEPLELFNIEKRKNIENLGADDKAWASARLFMQETGKFNYTYHFEWLGRPIIQLPQDLIAMQEIIWKVKPDLIIETGIALGGSLIFFASMLELLGGDGRVVGVDIDIRAHNRVEIENHPMFKRITMIQGSSVDEQVAQQVRDFSEGRQRVLVVLDSNHTHEHVTKELALYSHLVTRDSYLIVCDTVIEDVPDDLIRDRPWGKGNNPKTAVWEFLKATDRFVIDQEYNDKLLITVAPDGYLRCVKD
jgi:cephalosporin hydroxylase